MQNNLDTIYALTTPFGTSGVSIIKVSGKKILYILSKLCCLKSPSPRHAYYCQIKDLENNHVDKCLVIYFEGPKSFTGENMVEFQVHGSIAIIKKLLSTLAKIKGCRPSEPGEFIKRSYINKKIDLLEAENINRLVKSETEQQRIIATQQSSNVLNKICFNWKKSLMKISSLIDAFIEFSEEDENISIVNIKQQIKDIISEIDLIIKSSMKAVKISNGLDVIIVGPPNVGKSSIFNLIVDEAISIVTSEKGTTRDMISSPFDFDGMKVNLIDSAGLRITSNKIEKIGIKKTREKYLETSKIILVLSPDSFCEDYLKEIKKISLAKNKKIVIIFNKSDLLDFKIKKKKWLNEIKTLNNFKSMSINCKNQENRKNVALEVIDFIDKNLIKQDQAIPETVYFGEIRQIEHLKNCTHHLKNIEFCKKNIEIISEEIRLAIKEIENINGNLDYEDKLDYIFNKFCIGK